MSQNKTPVRPVKTPTTSRVQNENFRPGLTPVASRAKKMDGSTVKKVKQEDTCSSSDSWRTPTRTPLTSTNGGYRTRCTPSTSTSTTPRRTPTSTRTTTPKSGRKDLGKSVLFQFNDDILVTPSQGRSLDFNPGTISVTSTSRVEIQDMAPRRPAVSPPLNRSLSASSLVRTQSAQNQSSSSSTLKRSHSEMKISSESGIETQTETGERSRVCVGVRVRPLHPREHGNAVFVSGRETRVANDLGSEHKFLFDHCFTSSGPEASTQSDVYEAMVKPLVNTAFDGYNACLFAYGQTGSGKTYSMMGPMDTSSQELSLESGVIPRFCHELLTRAFPRDSSPERPSVTTTIEISYLEVYNEKIHDLLVPGCTPLKVREHPLYGPHVADLTHHSVNSYKDFWYWLDVGNKKRATGSTEMNDKSSRSHSLFSVILTQTIAQVDQEGTWSHEQIRRSQINLVDLAGSERMTHSTVSTDRLREGVSINRSLLTLGKVISALVERRGFVPYRESVLTWLLKESLGGNSKTAMLATVSPSSSSIEDTLATLRYASKARSIVNTVRVNEAPQDKLIRELKAEVERLKSVELEKSTYGLCNFDDELLSLRTELGKIRTEYEQLVKERTNTEEVDSLKMDLNKMRAQHESLKQHYLQAQDELDSNQTTFHEKQCEIEKLKSELEKYRSENEILERKLEVKDKYIQVKTEEINKLKNELNCLNTQDLTATFVLREELCKEQVNHEEVIQTKNDEIGVLNEKINSLMTQLKINKEELNKFSSERLKLKTDIEHLEEENETLESNATKMEFKLKEALDKIQEMKSVELKSNENLSELEKEVLSSRGEMSLKDTVIESLQRENAQIQKQLCIEQQEKSQLLSNTLEMTQHSDELMKVNLELNSVKLRLDNELRENEKKSVELNKLTEAKTMAEKSLVEVRDELAKTQRDLTTKINELKNFDSKYKILKTEMKTLEKKFNKTSAELLTASEALKRTEEEKKSLVEKLEQLNSDKIASDLKIRHSQGQSKVIEEKEEELQALLVKYKEKCDELTASNGRLTEIERQLGVHRMNEDSLRGELSSKTQQVESLQLQLKTVQKLQEELMEEKLTIVKVMEKQCIDNESIQNHKGIVTENNALKRDVKIYEQRIEKKSAKIKTLNEKLDNFEKILRAVVDNKINFEEEKAFWKKVADEKELSAFEFVMNISLPHHWEHLTRKARTYAEKYKIPYDIELLENRKGVQFKNLIISARAVLTYLQLSEWVKSVEIENDWRKEMDKKLPWTVDFGDYYETPIECHSTNPVGETSAVQLGVKKTNSGLIDPIVWRKTLVQRHVRGIREDANVLIEYFKEGEDSLVYSILNRIQVAVERLEEETKNVVK